MIIGTINQTTAFETRVCITPQSAAALHTLGFDVMVEKSAGLKAGFSDNEYQKAGAKIKSSADEICQKCDALLYLSAPKPADIKKFKERNIIIGNLENNDNLITSLKKKKTTCLALEKLPRLSRAQPFDILSSQNNLSGYRAVIEAVSLSRKSSPMMITSAGTLPPLKFLIIGIGVAGLQAIATAKRLGGKVYASDPRNETKEQAQSLGATFVEEITDSLKQCDIIISSAFQAGKQAPLIINESLLQQTQPDAVLIDMAAGYGGNIEGAKNNEIILKNGRTICGNSNFAAKIPCSSSILLANNLCNFVKYIYSPSDKNIFLDFNDEIIQKTCILKG